MTIFDESHKFVVFAPGSGGNFVAGILDKIKLGTLSDLSISSSGSSHVVKNGKKDGNDSISFGSNPEENSSFMSIADKESYYLNRILTEYNVPFEIITWSHDFSNLPLYKKYFPNCRTITITCYSPEDKLTSIMMHVNKVILSDETDIPILDSVWQHLKSRLKTHIGSKIKSLIEVDIDIDYIFENRCGEYRDLVFYLSCVILMRYGGLNDALNLVNEPTIDLIPTQNINIRDLVIKHSDVILPYSYLSTNNVALLHNAVSTVFERNLTQSETDYINSTFNMYRSKQNIEMLSYPLQYFKNKKIEALTTIQKIKKSI